MKRWQFSLTEVFGIVVAVIALAAAFGHSYRQNQQSEASREKLVNTSNSRN